VRERERERKRERESVRERRKERDRESESVYASIIELHHCTARVWRATVCVCERERE